MELKGVLQGDSTLPMKCALLLFCSMKDCCHNNTYAHMVHGMASGN